MTLKDLIESFNIAANTAFNKGYQELNPQLASLVYRFNSGPVSSTRFPITRIMSKITKFTGNRIHNSPSDSYQVTITNEEYDGSVDIPRRDLLRARAVNSIAGLDIFVKEIGALGPEAKDKPMEDVLDLIESGHTNTYGTTFDNQNFFDTTHAFDNEAGTQSNLLTGSGASEANIITDINKAINALRGFYYEMDAEGGNSKKRKLNKNLNLVVVCPDELVDIFEKINKAEYIGTEGGNTNVLKGRISQIISRPFTDANDWYMFEVSDSSVKPFIVSMEEEPKIQNPQMNDYNVLEHKEYTWGIEGFSYGKGYGAWWKGVKVTNA